MQSEGRREWVGESGKRQEKSELREEKREGHSGNGKRVVDIVGKGKRGNDKGGNMKRGKG